MAKVNLADYYTASQAAERLTLNSGRTIKPDYPRSLARYGKVRTLEMGNGKLYLKADIDKYVVKDQPGPQSLPPGERVRDRRSGNPPGRPPKQPKTAS